MTITRNKAKTINADVEKALAAVAEKHGLDLRCSGCSFSDTSLKPKIEFIGKNDNGLNEYEEEFKFRAPMNGLDSDMLGKMLTFKNKKYKIVGWNSRKPKWCIMLEGQDGGRSNTTVANVHQQLG